MSKVSCIIPAYNEAARIKNVLRAVENHSLISEVIVVDDASTDGTKEAAAEFHSARVIVHEVNKGKSQAIITGIKLAKEDFLLFLDADLEGMLTPHDVTQLIEPVLNGEADISISLRKNAPPIWHWIGLDYISGERVLPKKLLSHRLLEIEKLPKFGLETWINKLIIAEKYRIKVVPWNHIESPFKYKKQGKKYNLLTAIKGELPMLRDIFTVASPIKILIIIWKMLSLRV